MTTAYQLTTSRQLFWRQCQTLPTAADTGRFFSSLTANPNHGAPSDH
ncbi:hypothetical protein NON20_02395 [Synechocystis sp. B12]|nr:MULTISPECIES: hypothetical protein [unclassified Synechocystis]WLT38680.1 hypothetical protein NON20_02395 [Synechocystis sp. B12]MBD2617044.1 hypothetical protein [Synechocystis sp. FACHB-898]MBD2638719.1 hypothetical protein [Synechocystis sp. FACHB-908]MBD2659748.1 hypothetical protein [Synechocystis sp. FACHB-929]NHL97551.1 hypothetical protein [Synechocystis sp. PCC 6803]